MCDVTANVSYGTGPWVPHAFPAMAFAFTGAKVFGGEFNHVNGNLNWIQSISREVDNDQYRRSDASSGSPSVEDIPGRTAAGVHRTHDAGYLTGLNRFTPYPVRPQYHVSQSADAGAGAEAALVLDCAEGDTQRVVLRASIPPPIPYHTRPRPKAPQSTMQVFNAVGGHMNHYQIHGNFQQTTEDAGLQNLSQYITPAALYNSAKRYQHRECHPGTRTSILVALEEWSRGSSPGKSIFWLFGSAGTGKSTIAQTLAARFEAEERLGASFFFSHRDAARRHGARLFATLAYQLAHVVPHLKELVKAAVQRDPLIGAKGMRAQLEALIIQPYQRLDRATQPPTFVVVIDGLDECRDHGEQKDILGLLFMVASHRLPLRILITSRPETHIQDVFAQPTLDAICDRLALDTCIHKYQDVRGFLRHEFRRIRLEYETMADIPEPWPSDPVLELLVRKSSGQFIYAATVIQFVGDEYSRPTERLDALLGVASASTDSPFAELDQLYRRVLSEVPNSDIVLRVLGVVLLFPPFLGDGKVSQRCLELLLDLRPGDARLALRGMHSLMQIPTSGNEEVHSTSIALNFARPLLPPF
ncbi:hypothetical protein B0H11DRAFT_1303271 [Mycena galericulata]|nr:hypothetical protein B0H11DRAFT_1303271 [Mycena galericulata]